ncbi:MAG: Lysine exporter protein [Actinotalea sp.]|nr:Lysine exporter protein [Actinotalea sp.]
MTAVVGVGFLTALSLIVVIGAQNAFVLRQGLLREHVLAVVLLCAVADAVLVTAGVAGVGALVTEHPTVLAVARYGGAAFLLVLGVQAALRAARPRHLDPADRAPASLSRSLLTAAGLTLLNPHVYLDTVVLLGSLAAQHGPARWAFGGGAVAASVVWFFGLGFGARYLAPVFARPRAWQVLDGGIALVMTGLAVSLVV